MKAKIETVNGKEPDGIKTIVAGNDVRTRMQVMPHGFESIPVKMAKAVTVETLSSNVVSIGIIHREIDLKTGEARFFATDLDGNMISSIHANESGEMVVNGGIDYAVKYNELKREFDKLVQKVNDIALFTSTHVHPIAGVSSGTSSVVSAASATGVSATDADITSAKVEKLRV